MLNFYPILVETYLIWILCGRDPFAMTEQLMRTGMVLAVLMPDKKVVL